MAQRSAFVFRTSPALEIDLSELHRPGSALKADL